MTTGFPRWQGDSTASFVYELCKGLIAKGHQIVVLAPHYKSAKLREEMDGIKVYRFPYFWPKKYQRLCYEGGILPNLKRERWLWIQVPLLSLLQLVNAVIISKKGKFDLIHSHWVIPSGLAAWVCKKLFKRPFIVTIHGSDVFPFRKSVLNRLLKIVLGNCDACTVNSDATASAVSEIVRIKEKLVIIPMGVDLSVFRPEKGRLAIDTGGDSEIDEPVILTVGRLIEWKGVNYLIEAMPLVLESVPQARLVIYGDGPERKNLEELTYQLNMTERIKFEGNVPNNELPNYYRDASVFVLPSIIIESTGETEALGVVLLEAMACGTPVIASNVGGIPSIIKDGWNGFLTEQKNPRDLADKIVKLLSNKKLMRRFSELGLQTVRERFSWEVVTGKFSDVYESLLCSDVKLKSWHRS